MPFIQTNDAYMHVVYMCCIFEDFNGRMMSLGKVYSKSYPLRGYLFLVLKRHASKFLNTYFILLNISKIQRKN
jgi:hypothetical protein